MTWQLILPARSVVIGWRILEISLPSSRHLVDHRQGDRALFTFGCSSNKVDPRGCVIVEGNRYWWPTWFSFKSFCLLFLRSTEIRCLFIQVHLRIFFNTSQLILICKPCRHQCAHSGNHLPQSLKYYWTSSTNVCPCSITERQDRDPDVRHETHLWMPGSVFHSNLLPSDSSPETEMDWEGMRRW